MSASFLNIRPLFGLLKPDEALTLERLQASAARRVPLADWHMTKSELFEELEWPSLRCRREVFCMTVFYRLLRIRQPPLSELSL